MWKTQDWHSIGAEGTSAGTVSPRFHPLIMFCPRRSDQCGPLYETVTGAFQSRGSPRAAGSLRLFVELIEQVPFR
jgi:hypothetical protein